MTLVYCHSKLFGPLLLLYLSRALHYPLTLAVVLTHALNRYNGSKKLSFVDSYTLESACANDFDHHGQIPQ